jgi:TolA-binding protein
MQYRFLCLALVVFVTVSEPSTAWAHPSREHSMKGPASVAVEASSTPSRAITVSPAVADNKATTTVSAPATTGPIKGFHPIKRALQPIENLEGMSIKLEQQIVKLEGPISALHAPMVGLEEKLNEVDGTMEKMHGQLSSVNGQMTGVRSDLAKMRSEIADLKGPILAIQPLIKVAHPLDTIKQQLVWVVVAITVASLGVVFGTPFAAVLIYRNKEKFFPSAAEGASSLQEATPTASPQPPAEEKATGVIEGATTDSDAQVS